MHKLNKTFLKHNKVKGFSLVEILMALGLLGIVGTMAGGLHIDALRIFNFQNAIVDRQQLYTSLAHTIGHTASCQGNLAPKTGGFPTSGDVIGLYNDGTGADPTTDLKGKVKELYTFNKTGATLTKKGSPLIKIGNFGEILEVVKIALKNPDTTKNEGGVKQLKVYYKYRRGFFKTKSGGTCTNADQTGCYVMACTISDYTHTGSTTKTVDKCQASCTAVIVKGTGGGGSVDCYTEYQAGTTKAIYVGCGTTKGNKQVTTTAYGLNAGNSGAGGKNTFIGRNAGKVTTSSRNTFIGNNAGSKTTTGFENVFIGYQAGKENLEDDTATTASHEKEASRNTFIGAYAGENNTSGRNHVFIGELAGQNSGGGQSNTFVGPSAGRANSGSENTFIGVQTGMATTTTNGNTFIGAYAGNKNTGGNHVFIGAGAGADNVSASNNTFVGHNAGNKTTGGDNVFIGREAGFGNTTGAKNLFIGYQAGKGRWTNDATSKPVTGRNNIAIGNEAGVNLTNGGGNTFIGNKAGNKTEGGTGQQGKQNIFIGNASGEKNTTGAKNVFIGLSAGKETTSANRNTFIGNQAGQNNTTGGFNVVIGAEASFNNTTGSNNVLIGRNAGTVLNSGTDKTTPANNNIFIGHEASKTTAGGISATGNRQLNIGNLLFGILPDMNSCKENLTNTDPSTCTGGGTPAEKNDAVDFFSTTNVKYLKGNTGLVVNGNLYVRNKVYVDCDLYTNCRDAVPSSVAPASSRTFKNTITPFKNYQYSLSVINNTPLFTYFYNKDHPKHKRMGIISEDLPKHLQIKNKGKPPKPDWVSIYGTLWAGIKALSNKFNNLNTFKEYVVKTLNTIFSNIHKLKATILDIGKRLEVLEKENKELKKENRFFKQQIKAQDKIIKTLRKEQGVK